jgi:hypothetical protein
MVFGRLLGKSTKMGGAPGSLDRTEALAHIERLESAIFRIGSVFVAHVYSRPIRPVIPR